MENATKALLIAGSVLIAILLIAVGLRVFNSTRGTTEAAQTTMNATEVSMFNNKFIPYIGNKKTKADAISLINLAIANNSTSNNKIQLIIYAVNDSGEGQASTFGSDSLKSLALQKVQKDISDTAKVKISIYSTDNQGRISTIEIRKAT